jgi:hypothetical protein
MGTPIHQQNTQLINKLPRGTKMDFDHTYADYLSNEDIQAITELEKKIGKRLLAYYTPPAASNLGEDVLVKIRDLEKKLCVRLVAYDSHESH